MKENKTGKYLKYAIGEIILVVIGILIAVQINNWNQEQRSGQQEIVILENILQDLRNDKIGLINIIERRTSKAASAQIMVSYYEGVEIEKLSDYYSHWTNVLYWEAHYPRNTAFKELVNSGNLSIIRNAEIRNALLDISASYEELFSVRDHMYDDYGIYLYNPYSEIIDYGDGIEAWANPDAEIDLSEEDVKEALQRKVIKNGFVLAAFNNSGIKNQLVGILNIVETTIDQAEKEINK